MKKITLILLFGFNLAANAQITSTFDTDADGWTFSNPAGAAVTVVYSSTGGNPSGRVLATYSSNVGFGTQSWIAPAKFFGNQMAFSLGMNLRFDLQQSQAGTSSNANGDVRIESGNSQILYSLPAKPAVAPAWSSYSLKLDETQGWRVSSTTGPLATRAQIIAALSNITAIEIRGTYATNASYTSSLDNVVLEQRTLTPAPVASSLSATSGKPGDVITITGSGFNTSASNNVVSFGVYAGIKAVVQSATATQLQVVVPSGAVYGPITTTNTATGLSSKTLTPFNPVFDGGGRIIPASFRDRFTISTIGIEGWFVGDVDGDGWEDFAVANNNTEDAIDIYRNLGLGGDLSAASFAAKITIPMPPLGGSGTNGAGLWFADLDGDGKMDAISSTHTSAFNAAFVTMRNISTSGNIAFEAPEYWAGLTDETPPYFVGDIDGDGRPDLVGGEGSSGAGTNLWVAQNISSLGNIEFGASVGYFSATVDGLSSVAMGDLNSDGKTDMIVSWFFGDRFSIIQNNSTAGVISMTDVGQIITGQYNRSMQIVDVNLDGKNDLMWKKTGGGVYIRINNDTDGILTDTDFATEFILTSDLGANGGISIVDFNGDGKHDIASTDDSDVGVYENIFIGGVFDVNSFVPAYQVLGTGFNSSSPIVSDLNRDGKPDFVMASSSSITIVQNKNVNGPYISINTVSPLAAPVGATVTITGNNFSTVLAENHVYFGAVEATVLTATSNQLTASVPAGAAYAPVSVRVGELTSRYRLPFVTTFSSGVTFNNTHFAPPINFTLTAANYDIEVGDLNRDGKPDILAEGNGGFAFRNTHAAGAISISSLIADDTLSAGSFLNPRLEDFDGDGFLDAASVNGLAHRNISTPTEISFQPSIGTGLGASTMDQADFNNDGKIDFTVTTDLSGLGDLVIKENRSIVGSFTTGTFGSFSNNIVFNKPAAGGGIASEDFDGDGFADIATTNPLSDNISVYRNAGVLKISNAQFASRTDLAVGDNPGRIYKGDFDADGKVDLLLYHGTGANTTLLTVFHNTSAIGNISFTRIDLTNPSATTVATVADLDGDGKPEIITTSETGNRFSIFKNIHTSGALTTASFAAPFNTTVTAPRGITTGDLNLDGKPEIILTRAAGLLLVYENLVTSIPIVPPTITSFTPTSGPAGSSITITGTDFDALAINNIVYFGAVKAVVTAATSTQLTVTVPSGAGYGRINILNKTNGRASLSPKAFTPTFDGGGRIIPASFKPKFDIPTIPIEDAVAADVDDDGWIDLAVTNNDAEDVIDIYRNLGLGGTLSPSSFATKVSVANPPLGSPGALNGAGLWFTDLDGDGKQDAISYTSLPGFLAAFVTLRNISTPGNISFEAPEYWQAGTDETPIALVADLDGDGRPELVSGEGAIPGAMWFNQNISSPGNIVFGASIGPVGLSVVNGFSGANAGDLNGDGKPELVVSNAQGGAIDILQNTSTPGSPLFIEAFQIAVSHRSIFIVDMNLDGKNDLIFKSGVGFRIRLNSDTDGTLTAADFATEIIITGDLGGTGDISIGDINGDGKPDILDRDDFEVGVYENIYSGGVFDATAFIPTHQYRGEQNTAVRSGPLVADLNGDGKPEMIVGVRTTVVNKISIYENKNVHAPIIAVNTVSPLAAPIGATVTITGDFFSTIPAQNIVRFGAVRATVLTATKTQLTVSVPPGAAYAPVSVTKDGLSSSYRLPFKTTFGPGVTFDNTHFAPPVNYTLTTADYNIAVGDLNNDGKPDVVAEAGNPLSFTSRGYAFRNEFTSGAITTSTLVANDTLGPANFIDPTIQDFDGDGYLDVMNGNSGVKRNTTTGADINFSASVSYGTDGILSYGDFNSDGKVDVVATNATIAMQILENRLVDNTFVTTPLSSFSTVINFTRPSGNGGAVVAGDFDGDGFDDAITTNSNVDNISIFRNLGLGRITTAQFATRVDIAVGDIPSRIYSGDFDADGKLDLLFQYGTGTNPTMLTIMHNTSTAGNISFTRIDLTNPSNPTLSTIADLDGDGKPEIITTSETGNRFSIFKNTHTSGALTAASFAAPFNTTVTAPRGITTGDLNLDGKPEIIITRAAGLLVVYENLIPSIPPPTITSFTPTSGPVGITVTINGTNFDTTPNNNTVKFNGTTAVVTASTATSITTTVPTGASTGLISVTVGTGTGVSATNFTVTASPIITITTQPSGFTACVGQAASFTTAASGTTNIIYQWQFSPDGIVPYIDIANGGGYSNSTTATLSVNTTGNFGLGRYRCRINGDFASEVITNDEGLSINAISTAPTVVGANRCGAGSVTLTASGGTNGQYKWYTTPTGGTAIAGETNGSYVTPSITSTTSYYVSLNTNGCESTRTVVTATLTITPAPTATGVSGCPASIVTLTASGGTNGQYNWYTVATGGTAIAGATNNTYQIPSLTATSTFYVSLTISGCESTRTAVTATLLSTGCAPVITTQTLTTQIEGKIEINLQSLITTPGTLDPTSIKVITQPASGALASITNFLLVIDYKGKPFSGKETTVIEVCNTNGLCAQQTFTIEVAGDVIVFNAVSPNGDGKNEFLVLQYIESISPKNQVSIYNRWGDEVFSISDYDNKTRVFAGLSASGNKLPSGTYFYKIIFANDQKTISGFLSLR